MPVYILTLFDRSTDTQHRLHEKQQALFTMLVDREREFGFHPDAAVKYPDPLSALLNDPIAYLAARINAAESARGLPFSRAVVLTTYGNFLAGPLSSEGYREEIVNMPAGPENTRFYSRNLRSDGVGVFYLEAVNEMDEKIQPSFVLTLDNEKGELLAGMSGSIWKRDTECCAYISTVVAGKGTPTGVGSMAAEQVWHYLRDQGVSRVNLGTQTADEFYKRHGFRVIHTIIPQLRYRQRADGSRVWHDLVIMQKDL